MRFGITLPQFGPVIDPGQLADFAREAESLGYESLWVGDRALAPLRPSQPYPGYTEEQPLPAGFGRFLDPLATLTTAAAVTSTARLGSSTLLGRTLTTLDLLSQVREARELGYDGAFADPQFAVAGPAEMADTAEELMAGYQAG